MRSPSDVSPKVCSMKSYREEITEDLRYQLYCTVGISSGQVDMITEKVAAILKNYDITPAERSIVVYDNSDKEMVRRFFLAKSAQGLSSKSLKFYKGQLQVFLEHVGKHIKDIDADDIRLYLSSLRLRGCKASTQDNARRAISTFFSFIRDENYIDHDVSKKVKKIKTPERLKKAFTEDEMEIIREAGMRKGTRTSAIIEFLYSTGARVSECVGVNIEDIDFENKETYVIGKGNKMRQVYLSSRCVAALKRYLADRGLQNGPLFTGMQGRLTESAIESELRKIGNEIGIHVYPHRFRRTSATIALRRGMPLEMVGKLLGHQSTNTTTLYARSAEEDLKYAHRKYLT